MRYPVAHPPPPPPLPMRAVGKGAGAVQCVLSDTTGGECGGGAVCADIWDKRYRFPSHFNTQFQYVPFVQQRV